MQYDLLSSFYLGFPVLFTLTIYVTNVVYFVKPLKIEWKAYIALLLSSRVFFFNFTYLCIFVCVCVCVCVCVWHANSPPLLSRRQEVVRSKFEVINKQRWCIHMRKKISRTKTNNINIAFIARNCFSGEPSGPRTF